MSAWQRVIDDFDYYLDAPGRVSDRAMDALLAFLDIEVELSPHAMDDWAVRVAAAAGAGPARLVEALAHNDLSRIAAFALTYCGAPGPVDLTSDDEPTRLALHIAAGVHEGWAASDDDLARFGRAFGALLVSRNVQPGMLDALTLCAGTPGDVLAELPWAEPEWDTPVAAVDDLVRRAPESHVEWLLAMAARHPAQAPRLADSAARTEDSRLVEPYGIALLAHENVEIRRAAVSRLSRSWRTAAYQDAVAALLTHAELADAAVTRLAALADRRCLPHLVERIERVENVGVGRQFSAELLPHILRKLTEPTLAEHAAKLLLATATWGDPQLLMRPEAADVVDRLRRAGANSALIEISHRVSGWRRASPEMIARLRVLATEAPARVRQYAQHALLSVGDKENLVPVLMAEITEHPVRTGEAAQHDVGFGWRTDATACVWLGTIGVAAAQAVPVLRAMLTETGPAGEARAEAAEAYWRVTGDADTALSVVDSLASLPGDLGVRAREAAGRIRS
ncbi:hypothetical protein [Actinophytocola sp.]|uniref:hypothetical protein n=1 Tax=Actinophytocola sp. TaxID=1872138 RepID=UPI002ED10725